MSSNPARDPSVDDPRASLDPAIALFHRGELVQAAERCRSLLDVEPEHVDALSLLGAIGARAAGSMRPSAACNAPWR
jgi:Flp pilus assembly protein TadD